MSKKIKSTVDAYIESLTLHQRKKFEQQHRNFLLSEMLLASMEEDNIALRRLAELVRVS